MLCGGNLVPHFPKRGDCVKKVEDPCSNEILGAFVKYPLILGRITLLQVKNAAPRKGKKMERKLAQKSVLAFSRYQKKKKQPDHTRGITPKRVTSGGAHRGLALEQHCSEEMRQRCRAVGETVFDFTSP